uniref:Uncharacterized protein n=1 Tax=Rhizophora mucronata TaxID=61149 RepID=A0A2P2PEP6_RHIMU
MFVGFSSFQIEFVTKLG